MATRKIPQLVLGIALVAFIAPPVLGQGLGFASSPRDIFQMLDADDDDSVDPDEWDDANPFIRRILERLGVDLSQSMSLDSFLKTVDDLQAAREEQARAPEGGLPSSSSGDNDRSRDDGRRERDSREPGDAGGSTSARNSAARSRVTYNIKLPETYRARDKDRDGQIGFYEWPRNDLAGFRWLDHNGDGFLTPQELVLGPRKTTASGTVSNSSAPSRSTSTQATGAMPSSTAAQVAPIDPAASPAEKLFYNTDKDKNGTISEEEWRRSILVRTKFEKAGVTVKFPMARGEFLLLYPQAYGESK